MQNEPRRTGTTGETLASTTDALTYTVAGTVFSPTSAGVGNLTVQVVDKYAGPDLPLAQTTTDDDGKYTVTFTVSLATLRARKKTTADLQVRVSLGQTFLAASDVVYSARTNVTLNVTIPASVTGLPSEYATLTRMLAAVYGSRLGDLQENGDRTDITYLANKTGWDARAVALAALADQFGQQTTTTAGGATSAAIPPAFYYALFRAGLPANAATLYRAPLKTVSDVWTRAANKGLIPTALAKEIPQALAAFQQRKVANLLDMPPRPSTSTVRSLLQLALGNDPTRAQQFATLYTQHENDLPGFWASLQQTFGASLTARLQFDGQLAQLTLNNAPLMTKLYAAEGQAAPALAQPGGLGRWLPGHANNQVPPQQPVFSSLLDLVRRGYYQPSKWLPLLDGVPLGQVPGKTPDEQRANYAALMAAQLRLSYPTAVLAEMVNAGSIPLTADPTLRAGVYQFLVQNQGKYELGVEPLDQYLSDNGLTGRVDPNVVAQIKRLQRVYQITPSDAAMNALLTRNVDSAYTIAHYGCAAFVRDFQDAMGGPDVATQTFVKAQSVYNAVLNMTVDYLSRRVAPPLGNGTTFYLGPFPNNSNTFSTSNPAASATLETLFGSMDYCACDECRSILGPAAYLVDLLNFTGHQSPPAGPANPQDVLFARRPDLLNLLLTCDNTNVALPYIDLVNETLEYYAANGSLAGYTGHQTDGSATSSAELIACPQNVNDAAYMVLKSALFPPPLPFDRSLELLRLLFQKFDVSLQDAMAALRASDAIERSPSGPTAYGWRDILMEQIGLSREEYRILTDSTLTLQQLYGSSLGTTIATLSVVQDYSRGVGVSYDDLIAILKTRFINPNTNLIPLLEALNVPFATLAALKNGSLTPAAFLALLPPGAAAPDPAKYGRDIVAWIIDPTRYAQIMGLITIANPKSSTDLCSMKDLEFRYSNPDNTANMLQPIDFVRLLRFIRLWRKLGLTIQQTDDIISALAPSMSRVTTLAGLDAAFLALLPRIGFAYRVLTQLGLSAQIDMAGLLACWGPIGAYGPDSLYASMFLNPTMLRQDPAFAPDANGNVLQDTTQTIMAMPTRQKAVVGGTMTATDILTTTINGVPIAYAVVPSDTSPTTLAGHIAAAVNATTRVDPQTGLPLNTVVSATAAGSDITFAAIGSGGAFTLACSVSAGATETYVSLDHAPALRAAFHLTANEFMLIAQALSFDATTFLNLENISQIYRRGWLARELSISVAELLLLMQYTGLSPFAAPDPSPTPPAEPPVVRFIRLVQAMSAASLRPVQVLYLLWNVDISGASAPTSADVAALALTLRTDFASISAKFAIADDPTGAIAKSLVTLVFGTGAADFFFGLINNTFTVAVRYGGGVPQAVLDASSDGTMDRLSYDDFAKTIAYAGVLDAATFTAINTAIANSGGNAALSAAVAQLQSLNQAAVDAFFAQYPLLVPAYTAYVTSSGSAQVKRTALLATLLPLLVPQRKREQALADVAAAAGIDASFATALLTEPAVLHGAADAANPPTIPGVDDLKAIEAQGLSAQFYLTNNTALNPDQTVDNVPSLSYGASPAAQLPLGQGGSKIAGIWSGFITCPQDGDYDLSITTDLGASVSLSLGGAAVAGTQSGGVWTNTSAISLTAGKLVPIVLTVTSLSTTLSFSWRSSVLGLQLVPGQYLYSQTLMSHLATTYTRFLKATSLAMALSLDAKELAYLATDADYQVQGVNWVNALWVSDTPVPVGPVSFAFYPVLGGVLTYARLKGALAPKDDRLLNVIMNPGATLPNRQSALLTLTGWDQVSLNALLQQFFGGTAVTALTRVENFRRVYDAYVVVKRCGIGAPALLAPATNASSAQTVSEFQAALRARYAEGDWLTVIKPINDTMRLLQRDALTPYVLQLTSAAGAVVDINTPVTTPDTLFEYLLMDVQMDCCMETSRIRHALSSVQLFIERCIRGLEVNPSNATKNVDPGAFDADEWAWMKRYRVWQANREVFLWPENWLYPELRDDQSPFFKSIMSKLLQHDITDDAAASAYLEYLSDLEDVAKLEPCAMYYVPATSSTALAAVHVVARTSGAKRKYYYRSFDGAAWGPWEPIPLSIDDNPVALVQWNDRLLLFWLQVVQTPASPNQPPGSDGGGSTSSVQVTSATIGQLASGLASSMNPTASPPQVTIQFNLFWSEYYNGRWHPAKSSDTNNPATLGPQHASGPGQFDRSQIALTAYLDPDPAQHRLWLVIYDPSGNVYICFYNTHSAPVVNPANIPTVVDYADPYIRNVNIDLANNLSAGPATLRTRYTYSDGTQYDQFDNKLVSTKVDPVDIHKIEPEEPIVPDPTGLDWTTPFCFGDTINEFYVQTTVLWPSPSGTDSDYGVGANVPPVSVQAAPLMLKNVPPFAGVGPKFNPINPVATVATIDPAPIARYVTEDAYVSRGLGTTGSVQYGTTTIGVSGAIANPDSTAVRAKAARRGGQQ